MTHVPPGHEGATQTLKTVSIILESQDDIDPILWENL